MNSLHYHATYEILYAPAEGCADLPLILRVAVTNTGNFAWRSDVEHPIALSYHWRTRTGTMVEEDGVRTALGESVAPGERVELDLIVEPPPSDGTYLLELDLVEEFVCWFSQRDVATAVIPIDVTPAQFDQPVVCLYNSNCVVFDAVSNYMLHQLRFFQAQGYRTLLIVQTLDARQPLELRRHMARWLPELGAVSLNRRALEHSRRADLHIFHYPAYYSLIEQICHVTSGMVVWDYHGVTPPSLWEGPGRAYLEQSERARDLVRFADYAVAHSAFTRGELIESHLIPAEQTRQLIYAVPLDRFRPGPRNPVLLERYSLRPDQPVLLYVGRIAGNKRVDMLVRALPVIRAELPDVQLLLIGNNQSPPYDSVAAAALDLAATLGVQAHVRFLGQVSDAELPDHYRLADVFVTASLHEGFCIPVIEAMACGRPVVATNITALPETVGIGGLTFRPDDADDLARQTLRLLGSRAALPVPVRPTRIGLVTPAFDPAQDRLLLEIACVLHEQGVTTDVLTLGEAGDQQHTHLLVRYFPPDPLDAPFAGWIEHRIAVGDPISDAEQRRYACQRQGSRALASYLETHAGQYGSLLFFGDAGMTLQGVQAAPDQAIVLLAHAPAQAFAIYDETLMLARSVLAADPATAATLRARLPSRPIPLVPPDVATLAALLVHESTPELLYDQLARRALRRVLDVSRERLDQQLGELLALLAEHPAQQPSRYAIDQLRAAANPRLPPRPAAPTMRARLRDTLTERLVDPELAMLAERDTLIHQRLLDLLLELHESSSRRIRALEAHIRKLEQEIHTRIPDE